MTTLLIDNYDSYTYIIAQYLWEINGERPIVIKNDAMSVQTLAALSFDNIVISPGPGTPEHYPDVLLSMDVLGRYQHLPILGVCLGHQCIGAFFGGRIVRAPREQHGKYARLRIGSSSPLFEGIPDGITVVRYHSLVIEPDSLPTCLVPTAFTDDESVIMAVQHRTLPIYGVQFHPESIGTDYGKNIFENFRRITEAWQTRRHSTQASLTPAIFQQVALPWIAPEYIYKKAFYQPYSFWLDSSRTGHNGRYSFMGSAQSILFSQDGQVYRQEHSTDKNSTPLNMSFLDALRQETDRLQLAETDSYLPFKGGWVGYMAYDFARLINYPITDRALDYPEGLFMWVNRYVAIDHETNQMWLCGLLSDDHTLDDFTTWCQHLNETLYEQTHYRKFIFTAAEELATAPAQPIPLQAAQTKQQYLNSILTIKQYLKDGDSYEVCLTNEFTAEVRLDSFELYKTLRTTNPAPYSSFIQLDDVAFLSSSPECFLTISKDGQVKSEPIKGTWAKTNDADENERQQASMINSDKDRSELLMITDLIRNDLSMCCRKGTVETPKSVMVTEYATVHQLSSIITGTLQSGLTPFDVLNRMFPGGSITGAPKFRTVSLLDQLEQRARGLYTGSIGYVSVDAQADFNIAIRTMVHHQQKGTVSFGVGGAIIAESNPLDEYHEILLKAYALLRAVYLTCYGQFAHYRLDQREESIQQPANSDLSPPHIGTTPEQLEDLFTLTDRPSTQKTVVTQFD